MEETAPYFHDGSARTLTDGVLHYQRGGVSKANLSPLMRPLALTQDDIDALVAFMKTLSSPDDVYATHDRPPLPRH